MRTQPLKEAVTKATDRCFHLCAASRLHEATEARRRRRPGRGTDGGDSCGEQGSFLEWGQWWRLHSCVHMPTLTDLWGLVKEDRAGA